MIITLEKAAREPARSLHISLRNSSTSVLPVVPCHRRRWASAHCRPAHASCAPDARPWWRDAAVMEQACRLSSLTDWAWSRMGACMVTRSWRSVGHPRMSVASPWSCIVEKRKGRREGWLDQQNEPRAIYGRSGTARSWPFALNSIIKNSKHGGSQVHSFVVGAANVLVNRVSTKVNFPRFNASSQLHFTKG